MEGCVKGKLGTSDGRPLSILLLLSNLAIELGAKIFSGEIVEVAFLQHTLLLLVGLGNTCYIYIQVRWKRDLYAISPEFD